MAQRLYIWLDHEDKAGHPSTWEVIMHIPLTPPDGELVDSLIYEGLPFDDDHAFWGSDGPEAFVAWLQDQAPGSTFEFHHPADEWGDVCSGGSLIIPNDDHAFAARLRWPFLKLADW